MQLVWRPDIVKAVQGVADAEAGKTAMTGYQSYYTLITYIYSDKMLSSSALSA